MLSLIITLFTALIAILCMTDTAQAGPVFVAALSAGASVGSAFAATALGGFLSTTVGRLLMSVAFSALQAALAEKPKPAGIVTEASLTGSTQPLSFILGRYATAGLMQGPPLSHGKVGKVPNAYRQYVIVLGCIAGQTMERLMINGEYVDLGTILHADYGQPVLGRYEGYAWVKYYDGSQTVADPMLRAKYGTDEDRPWTADMVGRGMCYAILTFRFSQTYWPSGEPSWRFEMGGIPLYDPRKDSTVGGSGTQRWADRTTWQSSDNPIIQVYNIMRGITIPSLGVWGGEVPAEELPLSAWFSAANICDQLVTPPGGGTEKRYRTGYEVKVDVEPASVIEELCKAAATRISEVGGVFKPRTGGPGLPVYFMNDDDIVITSPQELDPFPGADQRYNGITTNGPDPEALWEAQADPEIYNTAWEAEDGGKRRMASLQLPACPYPIQRQRIARAYIMDERRFIQHQLTLPPDAAILEPLDTIGWTSARNGYSTKHFELGDMQDDVVTLLQGISMREVDPTDFTDPAEYGEVVTPVPTTRRPIPPQLLPGFSAAPGDTVDAAGTPRRPHILLTWDGDEMEGVGGVAWEVRLSATDVAVTSGTTADVTAGSVRIFDGILPNTVYKARAQQVALWPVIWSEWITVSSSDVRLGASDLANSINAAIAEGQAALVAAAEITDRHDALVAGFTGTLVEGFNAAHNDVLALDAEMDTFSASLGGLNTTVTRILGARADLLAGTAFAALLTQLGVSTSTGLSATVANQASAIADLEGNASAMWGVKLTAGSATTSISFVAADDPTGPVSTGIFEMDNLLIRADQVLIAPNNAFGDYDMMLDATYSTDTSAVYSFPGTSSQGLGLRYLSISPSPDLETVYSDWFPVSGSTEYLVRAGAWLTASTAGNGTVTVSVETGSVNSSGAVTVLSAMQIKTATDTGYSGTTAFNESTVTTDAAARRMRFRIDRAAGGTGYGRAGGFRVEKKIGASLVINGSVTAEKLSAGEIITNTAQISNLIVSRAKFAQGALTDMTAIASDPVYTDTGTTNFGTAINISSYDLVLGATSDACPEKIYLDMGASLASISYTSASGQRFGLIMATEVCKVDKATGAITTIFVNQDQMYDISFTTTSPYPVAFAFAAKTSAQTGANLIRGVNYNVGDDIRVYFYYQKTRSLTTGSFTAKLKNTGFFATLFYR